MSDVYNYIFSNDPKTGALSFEQLQARRKIANALATRNRGFPKTIGEGLTYFGESLGDMYADKRMAANEAAYKQQSDADVQRLSQPDTAAPPATVAPPATSQSPGPMAPGINPFGAGFSEAPEAAPADTMHALAMVPPDVAKNVPPQVKLASMSIDEWKQRTKRNESGGQPDPYRAIGPVSRRGDYPYGAYQVMGENIPKWTKAYLGKEMTPQEFLDSPDAQEQVATGQGGKYLAKYGPIGAAEAWFAGEKGRVEGRSTRRDTLGTHIDEYVRRFNVPLVSRDQVAASAMNAPPAAPAMAFAPGEEGGEQPPVQLPGQVAALDAGTVSDAAPATADPRVGIVNSLVAQQQPAPPPPPQQVAQAAPLPQPVGRPVPTTITPAPSGPPAMPDQEPMTAREMEIRRRIGSTSDENFKGQLQPIVDRLEAERKFKDAQKMELWKKDVTAYEKRTDPMQRAQLEKLQQEQANEARERMRTEARGGVSQAIIDEKIKESAKTAGPLREASTAINQVEGLLEKGIFSGTLGKFDLALAKAKQAVGGAVDPRVAQTENFTAAVKPIVAAARAALAGGANISDRDMMAAEAAAGGDITLTKEGIQGIMKSLRTIQMQTAQHHQKILSTAAGGDTAAENTLYGLHGLPMENIIPKNHPTIERLMQNADNEHERGLFNKAWHTPGLAEKIIARNRAR